MKPKETQVLGLYILGLISFIILAFAQLHSVITYVKLTTLDSVTSFAVVDAVFFTVIKLLITLYVIFYLSVDIRGQFIQRERLRNKILAKLKQEGLVKSVIELDKQPLKWENKGFNVNKDNEFTLQDLANEVNLQVESSNLNFEPVNNIRTFKTYTGTELAIMYGREAINNLKEPFYTNLRLNVSDIESFQALNMLYNWYKELEKDKELSIKEKNWWNNIANDRELLDIEINSK